jgi:hypothetical protein
MKYQELCDSIRQNNLKPFILTKHGCFPTGYNQLNRKHKKIARVIQMRGYAIIGIDNIGIWYNDAKGSTHLYRVISKKAIACLDKPCIIDYFQSMYNQLISNLYLGGTQY